MIINKLAKMHLRVKFKEFPDLQNVFAQLFSYFIIN
jgi:hypothetical protein